MLKNSKFITLIFLLILSSCSSSIEDESVSKSKEISYEGSGDKYKTIYYKIAIELLLHKGRTNDALEVFSSNIHYFNNENDFVSMINIARDLRQFEAIEKIVNKWLKIDENDSYANKIAFSIYVELGKFDLANKHFNFLYNEYLDKNQKSFIDIENILSRNIIIQNIVEYFENNLSRYDNEIMLISYIDLLQKNNLDELAVSYLKNDKIKKDRIITRKYSNSLSKLNKSDIAIRTLEDYLDSSSITDREVSFELLGLYLKTNNIEKSTLLADQLVNIDFSDDDFIFRVALLCFDNENYGLSEKYFNVLLSKTYASDNINFFLGQIDYNNGRYEEALLHYNRIQQGTFINTKILNTSKAIYKKFGIKKALSFIENEINLKNKDDALRLLLLKLSIYEEADLLNNVIDISNKILSDFPDNIQTLYTRAISYEKQGNILSMSEDFEKMIKLNPYDSIALNAYGYSLAINNIKLDKAESLIRRAIKIDPGNPAIIDSLAWILYLKGSYKKAYNYSALAYSKDQDPEIVEHYYKILLKINELDKAEKILKESLINNPNNKQLLELLNGNQNVSVIKM
jgi:tetratricopeptide (TPR) repeat protein